MPPSPYTGRDPLYRPADGPASLTSATANRIAGHRNDDSWVEVASQPSSSSVSSIADEIVITGLRVGSSANGADANNGRPNPQRRRRLLQQVEAATAKPAATATASAVAVAVPPAPSSLADSSQEEYDETESDEDRAQAAPGPTTANRAAVRPVRPVSDGDDEDEDDDDNGTALGVPSVPTFRPQPNAFSHPPTYNQQPAFLEQRQQRQQHRSVPAPPHQHIAPPPRLPLFFRIDILLCIPSRLHLLPSPLLFAILTFPLALYLQLLPLFTFHGSYTASPSSDEQLWHTHTHTHTHTDHVMSSPAGRRSTRSSQAGTPGRPQRGSGPAGTPGGLQAPALQQLVSSPLFYESSPGAAAAEANMDPSSPLRQMSNTQSTQESRHDPDVPMQGIAPSSPLAQMDTQSSPGDRTPRASRNLFGESSPVRYFASSSPGRQLQSDLRSETSGLFVSQRAGSAGPARSRRGDINSDSLLRTPRAHRVILNEAGHVVSDIGGGSETGSFATNNPDTSEAQALGGMSQSLIWGTTVSIDDTFSAFKDFLRNFTKKYRLWLDGKTELETADMPDAESKPYWETMQNMLLLGTSRLYVDIRDLKAYPRTNKLWYQAQAYPQEIVPIMDQSVHDLMSELAHAEVNRQKAAAAAAAAAAASLSLSQSSAGGRAQSAASQSSELNFPSSERGDEPATPRASQAQAEAAQTLEDDVSKTVYIVRPYGLDKSTNLRDLNPADMDRLISIKGLVIRTTPVIPDMKDAFFKCQACNHSVTVSLDRGKIREPTVCPRPACGTSNSMQIVHNRCIFEDKQVIKLQETPDAVPAGQTPHSVSVCVYNELVDFCKAGDRVLITGIFRVSPVRINPRQRTINSVHKTYVDVLHIQKVDNKRLGVDPSTLDQDDEDVEAALMAEQLEANGGAGTNRMEETRSWTAEEEAKIKSTGERPDIYDLLSRSLAPSIYEMDDVKKGILLQLFGGTNKTFKKGGSPKYRGDINVLLCGDPSTAKSQMLSYIHKIAPRGVYTSGKGSSAVGLTAYVTRDPETRQLVLESGALVLSDGGVCCIDEFDKMNDSTRSVLHEVMEQQTVSVAKAGIITTLNARTSILASANPIGSRYNPDLPVPQNIDLPPTLLSRFDLVYLILDRADEKTDRRMAKHLLSMYLEDTPQSARSTNEILPVEFLTSYISYARANVHPVLSNEAGKALVEAYVEMRKLGQDVRAAEKRITATTRQLESMIRLAEAHAKMRLSVEVTADDVREAYRLIQSALKTAATDSQGRIDMSLLTEGTSAAERKRKADLSAAILRMLDDALATGQTSMRSAEVSRRMAETLNVPIEAADMAECLRSLEMEGSIAITGEGARRTIRRSTGVA